ncbi:Vacuolar import and degradation protein 27 [Mucor circinelloides]
MSYRNIYFDMEQPVLFSLNDGQFSAQYRNDYRHMTVEHIFDSAALQIRRTSTTYQYELRVKASCHSKYAAEQVFPVNESMQLRLCRSNYTDNGISIIWYSEECDESFEFSCSESMEADHIKLFMLLLYDCIYENSYQTPRSNTTEADIKHLFPVRTAPKLSSSFLTKQNTQKQLCYKFEHLILEFSVQRNMSAPIEFDYVQYKGSKLSKSHSITEYISSLQAELYEYIPQKESFIVRADVCAVDLVRLQNNFTFALIVSGNQHVPSLSQIVDHQINPNFNKTAKTFTWNYLESGRIYAFMLKIPTDELYDDFSASFAQCLFENSTRIPFRKSRKSDQNYVISAFGNSALDDFDPLEYTFEETTTDDDWDDPAKDNTSLHVSYEEKTFFDAFSSSKSPILLYAPATSQLFVLENNSIAIYQQLQGNMQFCKAIYDIKTLNNQELHINQAILYKQEAQLLLLDTQNPHNTNKIHKFDITEGKVVDEWHIEDEGSLLYITPSFKSAAQSDEQTICGITSSAVFRIDPLQAGNNKIKSSEYKKHITKTNFSVAVTTEAGHLAVAGNRGDIKLFDALNTMAKTTLPSIGEPILALDTTASGRYIIATCADFLMLVEVEGQHTDKKPIPIILRLQSKHVMLMQNFKKFTRAYFDVENRIMASTGQYLIMWSLQDIYHGRIDTYKIKKLDELALASCQINANNSIIVASANGIISVPLATLKASCNQSLLLQEPVKDSDCLQDI